MKNFSFILLRMLMLASCSEVEDDSLERITDTIRGKYECKSVSIQGRSLDLNGDGIVSGNMLDEFEKFWRPGDILLRVFPVRQYGEEQVMSVEIPKQDVYYDKRSGEYETPNLYGYTMFINFMYSIDETGALSIRPGSYNDISSEDDDMIYHIDFRENAAWKRHTLIPKRNRKQKSHPCSSSTRRNRPLNPVTTNSSEARPSPNAESTAGTCWSSKMTVERQRKLK